MKVKVSDGVYKVIDSAGKITYVDEAGNPIQYNGNDGMTQPKAPEESTPTKPSGGVRLGFRTTPFRGLGVGEQFLSEFVDQLKEIYKSGDITDIKVVPFDKDTFGIAMSVVGVVKITDAKAVVYLMALEATSTTLKGIKLETVNPQSYIPYPNTTKRDRFITPSDVFDSVLYGIVDTNLKDMFHVQSVRIAGGALVPEYMELGKDRLVGLAETAFEAVTIKSLSDLSGMEINIGNEIRNLDRHEQLVYRLDIGKATLYDETQFPKRSQFIVSLNLRSNVQQQSINIVNNDRTIVRTAGFVDVVPMRQTVGAMQGMMPMTITRFHPHIIMDYCYNVYTDGYLLLNIASGLILRNNNVWMECIKPDADDKLHDPGALNILANIENNTSGTGEKVDFFAAGLSEFDIYNTLQRFFIDGVLVSVDVDLFSAPSWAFEDLVESTYNTNTDAHKRLMEHAGILTDGNIFKYIDTNKPIAANVARLPRGYWTDANGQRRDLREFDILAALNEIEDIGKLNEFIGAYVAGMEGYPMFLPTMIDVYKRIMPQGIVVTGWTVRITFTHDFIQGLEMGLRDAGFGATIEGVTPTPFTQSAIDVSTFFQNTAVTGQSVLVNQQAFGPGYYGFKR